jgi:hypothetical protein
MATAPQFNFRDGSGVTTDLQFTTNLEAIFLAGTITPDTVDVQVNVNGQGFISDPTLVALNGEAFTVPNPAAQPDGLSLDLGNNTVQVRAIDILGAVSPASTATITRVSLTEGTEDLIPTGIRLRRRRNAVDLFVAEPPSTATIASNRDSIDNPLEFRGYNFYAARTQAGTDGYVRINAAPVTDIGDTE